ncbi:TIGR02186 family protein [Rhodalgimonas zhirmunskyi]
MRCLIRGVLATALLLTSGLRATISAEENAATPQEEAAEQVVLGLSQNKVSITADFDGSDILIFGAIKREAPPPEGPPIEVVIVVEGPSEPLTVRKKSREFGIWVNTESVAIDSAPAFYAVVTSGPFREVLSHTEDLRHHVSVPRAIRSVGAPSEILDAQAFSRAVIRIRRDQGLYKLLENEVELSQQTLFQSSLALPANLTEGAYRTRVFLTRNGSVVSSTETTINVGKIGLERFLFNLSREHSIIYGIMSLAIAIIAGWGAAAVFRAFRQT